MKQKDWTYFILAILSIFACIALIDSIFSDRNVKKFTNLKKLNNKSFEEDNKNLQKDYDAIAGDMNKALKSLQEKYELQTL